MRVIKWMAEKGQILLIPIISTKPCEHFTLLVIRKDDERNKVRYFDSMHKLH